LPQTSGSKFLTHTALLIQSDQPSKELKPETNKEEGILLIACQTLQLSAYLEKLQRWSAYRNGPPKIQETPDEWGVCKQK
jgi:hypothetical protein